MLLFSFYPEIRYFSNEKAPLESRALNFGYLMIPTQGPGTNS